MTMTRQEFENYEEVGFWGLLKLAAKNRNQRKNYKEIIRESLKGDALSEGELARKLHPKGTIIGGFIRVMYIPVIFYYILWLKHKGQIDEKYISEKKAVYYILKSEVN